MTRPAKLPLLFGLLLFALSGLPPFAGAAAAVEIDHWRTPQGIAVYYVQRTELPMLDVRLVFDAGSARDGNAYGLANLSAHLLGRGAGGLDADEIAVRFEHVGAQYSASVGRDMTALSLRTLVAPDYMKQALDTFVTVLAKPDFPPVEFERLKKQVLTGIGKRAQEPGTLAGLAFSRAIYRGHPYAHPPQGEKDSVAAITLKDVRAFYRRYLVARNLTMIVVGDLARPRVEAFAARVAEALPAGAAPAPLPPLRDITAPREIRVPFKSAQAHIFMGQPAVAHDHADYFPLYLGNHILGGSGFGSRLIETVRVANGYAYSIWSYFVHRRERGAFVVGFETRSDQADDAIALTRNVIAEFKRDGPEDAELALAKDNVQGGFPLRVSDNGKIIDWVTRIAVHRLDLDFLDTFVGKVRQVEKDDIVRAFRDRIADDLTVVVVGG